MPPFLYIIRTKKGAFLFIMYRSAERALAQWFAAPQRKPLVIRGARQVGKSTLVRQFAQSHRLHLNEINLERHPDLDSVFQTLDLTHIRRELEGLLGQPLLAPGSLLFLDEIQATPHALPALRYFFEDHPELPVIAAGSLLEFVLSQHAFTMPVGRIQYFHLGPMSFEEFLAELDPPLLAYLQDYTPEQPLPHTVHTRLSAYQREYLLVGGMPEAVAAYSATRHFADVTPVHQSIVDTYQDDFAKYASARVRLRLQRVFNYVPRAVGRKVKYTQIDREETARELRVAIDLLAKARVIAPVFHSTCSGVPLHAEVDWKTYKLLFLDIGLMNRLCGLDWLALKDLDDRRLVNEGALAEQFVGQHLLYLAEGRETPRLNYWLREGKSANAEVDYAIARGAWIVPVEVKAGTSGTLRSLHQFALAKGTRLAVRFDLNPPTVQSIRHQVSGTQQSVEMTLLSLPLYLVGQLGRLLDRLRQER